MPSYPDSVLFVQGMGKMLYEPFRYTMVDVNIYPTPQAVILFLWTTIVVYYKEYFIYFDLDYITARILFLNILSIMGMEFMVSTPRAGRLFEKKLIKDFLYLVMYITFPVVLLFYVWFPVYDRFPCLVKRMVIDAVSVEEWKPKTWIIFSVFLFLSAIYGIIRGLKKPYKFRRSDKFASPGVHTPVTRSMSRRMR